MQTLELDTLQARVVEHGLRVDSFEAARMHRRVRAAVLGDAPAPTMIGRYEVLRRLGAGGMGVVYVARDAELRREVAVKLVLHAADGGPSEQRQLLDEARALARIAHPNVVAIHDVGLHEGRVFLAMELIQGTTLREFCAQQAGRWREQLAVYMQAGRGLAATHAAELVHRDFKPDNALVGADGRVQILDFGLAQHDPLGVLDAAVTERSGAGRAQHGSTIAGTIRYMAPEQLDGKVVDARADQFAFCVALWEALYREHPFPALESLSIDARPTRAVLAAAYRPPRAGAMAATTAPAWLRRVIERGLAIDPTERHASMAALLAALADDPVRRRRRRVLVGLGLAVIPVGLGVRAWVHTGELAACERKGAAIAEAWNDETRAAVRAAILAPDLSYGPSTWERIEPRLDAYAQQWSEFRNANCVAALEGQRQPDLVERSEECLLERRDDLSALLDELERARTETIQGAVVSVTGLPSLMPCDEVASLAERTPPPSDPALRAEVGELRGELSRSRALWASGRTDAALAIATQVVARADAIEWRPIQLRGLMTLGEYLERDDVPAAVERFERAFELAVRGADDQVALEVTALLARVYAVDLGRGEAARMWCRVAEAFVERADPGHGLPTAQVAAARASLARREGDFAAALRDQQQAVEIDERVLGPDDPRTLAELGSMGVLQVDLGDQHAAAVTLQRVVEGTRRALGPEHPSVARAMGKLAGSLAAAGEFAEARTLLEQALAIEERAFGRDHLQTALTLQNLALMQDTLGDGVAALASARRAVAIYERGAASPTRIAHALLVVAGAHGRLMQVAPAIEASQRALTIFERELGPQHPQVALAYEELARAHRNDEQYVAALAEQRRAVEIREEVLGPWHPDTGSGWNELARFALSVGDVEAASAAGRKALSILLGSYGPGHPNVVYAMRSIGLAQRMAGDRVAAIGTLRSAVDLAAFGAGAPSPQLAPAMLDLGDALVANDDASAGLRALEDAASITKQASSETEDAPDDALLVAMAEAELQLGRLDDAERHARGALERAQARRLPRSAIAVAQIQLAQVRAAQGHREEAAAAMALACAEPHSALAFRFSRCPARVARP